MKRIHILVFALTAITTGSQIQAMLGEAGAAGRRGAAAVRRGFTTTQTPTTAGRAALRQPAAVTPGIIPEQPVRRYHDSIPEGLGHSMGTGWQGSRSDVTPSTPLHDAGNTVYPLTAAWIKYKNMLELYDKIAFNQMRNGMPQEQAFAELKENQRMAEKEYELSIIDALGLKEMQKGVPIDNVLADMEAKKKQVEEKFAQQRSQDS